VPHPTAPPRTARSGSSTSKDLYLRRLQIEKYRSFAVFIKISGYVRDLRRSTVGSKLMCWDSEEHS